MATTYREIIRHIESIDPFMATPYVNMGEPKFTTQTPIACVQRPPNSKLAQLYINKSFLAETTAEIGAGALTHEMLHLMFSHLDDLTDPYYEDQNALRLAQECIVNDTTIEMGFTMPDGVFYGTPTVGYDCQYLPTKPVYDDICKRRDEDEEFANALAQMGNELHELPSGKIVMGDVDGVPSGLKKFFGKEFNKTTATKESVNMNWSSLVRKINPEAANDMEGKTKNRPAWERRSRKYASLHVTHGLRLPDSVPVRAEGQSWGFGREFVMALDCSGSINDRYVQEFIGLAEKIPKNKLKVHTCTFSTQFVPFTPGGEIASGGTDFNAIAEFIEYKRLINPFVVVITDGAAPFSKRRNYDMQKWFWLLIPGGVMYERDISENLLEYEAFVK